MRHRRSVPAKITRPDTSGVYLRKRLFRLLDEGRRYKALWVSGPPGSGKTTLVSSYIESRDIPCLWYQVDSGDSDPATLFHYIGLAAKGLLPGKRRPFPPYAPEYLRGLSTFTRNFFRELFQRMPSPFLLVLDNFQEASSDSTFLDLICECIQEAPEGCCTLFIGRNAPPAPFARACVNKEMKTIGWDELRLSDDEFAGIAKVLGYKIASREKLTHLQKEIQGWIAGLILVIDCLKSGIADKQCLLCGQADSRGFDYFMGEIFKKTEPAIQDFLMKTSLFSEITVEMARGLTGNKGSHEILHQLESERFFTDSHTDTSTIYQYHPLFRKFLQSCAERQFSREELEQVQGRGAHILEEAGYIEDAAALFIKPGDWNGLGNLILKHAQPLISQGRFQVLESWIASIPSDILNHSPWLLYYLGQCRMPQNPALARKVLEAAYRLFRENTSPKFPFTKGGEEGFEGSATGLFLSWSSIVDTFLYEWKDFKPLDFWIEEFGRLVEEYPEFPSKVVEEHAISSIFGALMFRQPQNPRLSYWEARAMAIVQDSSDVTRRFTVGHNLIFFYLWMGNMVRADVVVKTLLPVFKKSGDISLSYLMFLRAHALYHCYTATSKIAQSLVEEGLRLGEKTGVHLLDNMFLAVGIYSSYLMGGKESAERYFNMLTFEKVRAQCFKQITFHVLTSIKALHFDNSLSVAIEHAKLCLKNTDDLGCPLLINQHRLVFANALIENGKYDVVTELIGEIRKVNKTIQSSFHEYHCLLLESFIALKKGGNNSLFAEKFKEGMVLSRSHAIPYFGYLCLPSAAILCAKALEAGIEVEHVKELVRLNNLASHYTPDPDIEAWPWPVKIYTLGRFEIWRDDKRVEFPRKVQKKTLSLLKILITTGGREIPEEGIIDTLWPDADGDQAGHSFATALWRLRKLIGSDKVILYRDGQVTLDRQHCWVDIWGFDHLLRQSEDVAKGGQVDRATPSIRKAIAMYHGHFLAGDGKEPWTLSQRERLRDRFIMTISRLGQHLEEKGEIDEAISCYNRGIETDELAERLYQRLILCHHRTGNRTEAIRAYKRLKTLLSIHLGIEPSRETEAIYKSLLTA